MDKYKPAGTVLVRKNPVIMPYLVYCRECGWTISDPVELKGEANWLAGRHISEQGHSVALKEVEPEYEEKQKEDVEFYRHTSRPENIEILRPVDPALSSIPDVIEAPSVTRRCGPVVCHIQTV